MALQTPRVPVYHRNFGHCILTWKIKNFSLAICNSGTEIWSNEFTVSSLKDTRWSIGILIESENRNIQIILKRIGDESEESFKVSWKLTILNGKDEATFVSENQSYIRSGSYQRVDVVSSSDIIRSLPAEKSDEVKIALQMIVFMNTVTHIPTPKYEGYTSLVEDMKIIAKEGFLSDLTVMLNDKNMKGHRAVLCPRSKKLDRFAGCQSKKIQLYLSDTEAVNRIFAYLYTGDLKYILDPPSISIYDGVAHLDIKELQDAYPQERISLETEIEATSSTFKWTIRNFKSPNDCHVSEIFEDKNMDSKWQLRIYPKALLEDSEMKKIYIYIEAKAVESAKPQDVYLNVIARNDKDLVTVAKRTYGKAESGKTLGIFFMRMGSATMAKSIVDNVLDLTFSVHTATGKSISTTIKTDPPVQFNLTNFDTYKILANYLGVLQTTELYNDITLVVQGQEYKAHKFIIAGRSATLSRMIAGMRSDTRTLQLQNIHKHVFRVFLDYLYRGAVTDLEISILINLYDVASHFQVKSLLSICVKHLGDQLTPENCCYLLLFAEERRATVLKTRSLQYLSIYREMIIDNPGWRNMETKNSQLFMDVVYFLGNNEMPERVPE